MLGIRRFHETAVDVWQGELSQFAADIHIDSFSSLENFQKALGKSSRQHICCGPLDVADGNEPTLAATRAMATVRQLVESMGHNAPRRITFALATAELYTTYRDALFTAFHDD